MLAVGMGYCVAWRITSTEMDAGRALMLWCPVNPVNISLMVPLHWLGDHSAPIHGHVWDGNACQLSLGALGNMPIYRLSIIKSLKQRLTLDTASTVATVDIGVGTCYTYYHGIH